MTALQNQKPKFMNQKSFKMKKNLTHSLKRNLKRFRQHKNNFTRRASKLKDINKR